MVMQRTTLVYTPREAACLLGLSRSSLYEAIRIGVIPALRVGRRLLVPKAALERLLEGSLGSGSDDK